MNSPTRTSATVATAVLLHSSESFKRDSRTNTTFETPTFIVNIIRPQRIVHLSTAVQFHERSSATILSPITVNVASVVPTMDVRLVLLCGEKQPSREKRTAWFSFDTNSATTISGDA